MTNSPTPSQSYKIRPSHPSDSEGLSTLLKESFYKAFRDTPGVTEQFFVDYFNSTLKPENLELVLGDGKWSFLVAQDKDDGRLVGMIQILHPQSTSETMDVQIEEKESTPPIEKEEEEAYDPTQQVLLSRFYLLPSHQGSGLATQLFNEILKLCKERGYVSMKLTVLTSNHRGIRFYEKMGFKKVKEIHKKEGDGDKFERVDWIMIKEL